jgi:hypothetical protein
MKPGGRASQVACFLALLLSGCGSSPPSHTPSAPSTASPGASASGIHLQVSQAELLASAPVWTVPGGREQERISGSVVFVIGGLRAGWNRIQYPDAASHDWRFGWLAPNSDLEALPPTRCPRADAAHVLSLFLPEAETCYQGEELALSPVFLEEKPPPQPSHSGTPDWLASPTGIVAYAKRDGQAGAQMVHIDPTAVGRNFVEGWYSVVGHFDDPRSVDCVRSAIPPFVAEAVAEQHLWCRQQFVLTSLEPVPAPND